MGINYKFYEADKGYEQIQADLYHAIFYWHSKKNIVIL